VTEKEDLMITCVSGITIRMSVASVSEQGRATQGVKLIRVDDGDEIAAITKLDEEPEVPEEGLEATTGEAVSGKTVPNSDATVEKENATGENNDSSENDDLPAENTDNE